MSRFIVHGAAAEPSAALGGKARALAALSAADLPIPPWVVLTPEACTPDLEPSPEVRAELMAALAELCPEGELVAVRSSALDEDGVAHSCAGQLDSYLFVPPAEVPARVAAVWRSTFAERNLAYRREQGLSLPPPPPAVLIQRMVHAESAGVAFSADPVSGRRGVAVVSAVWGLGSALVSGEVDADTWSVDRDGNILTRQIVNKRMAHRADPQCPEGVRFEAVPLDQAQQPALTEAQVQAVAHLARTVSRFFGRPQDIEWACAAGQLHLLQARPITTLHALADSDGTLQIWDNSNIAESYNGVTTPLTFSFARRAYEEVYRQFCKLLRVPQAVRARNDGIFPRMLGLVRGRIYYNLLNWYRLLALLPGFTFNRRFMEQMMGVKEGLPDEIAHPLAAATWQARLGDGCSLVGSLLALVGQLCWLPRTIQRFYQRLKSALGVSRPDLSRLRPDELVSHYRTLEQQLLTRWDAPLVNDFFAMIFHGVLRRLTAGWCGDANGTLHNDLLCGAGGMISAEPAQRVRRLADLARQSPHLVQVLCSGTLAEIQQALRTEPAFRGEYQAYLERFGDRCLEELKLESTTLVDDPLPLLRSVGHLASRPAAPGSITNETTIRTEAEDRVRLRLRFHPLRMLLFSWVLGQARSRVRDRENLRFERMRLFGRVRAIFVELGRQLHALQELNDPRDVFYLELHEVLGWVEGTTCATDLKGLVAVRQAEFARYRAEPAPAGRFETRGPIHHGHSYRTSAKNRSRESPGDRRQGLGCCPGVVRGPVRIITDPRHATLQPGEILVAERTDPGWVLLFPAAAGLLVERGSLLSHSAIVARELGLPAIVALEGVTRWLRDGDWVELDGKTGIVVKLAASVQERVA